MLYVNALSQCEPVNFILSFITRVIVINILLLIGLFCDCLLVDL